MKNIFLFIFFLKTFLSFSQAVNVDPVLGGALIISNANEKKSYKKIKDGQKRIKVIQAFVNVKIREYKELNKKAQRALSQVNSFIRDSKKIVEIGIISKDILDYQVQILDQASRDPKLIALAVKSEKESAKILTELSADVALALKGGTTVLLSANDRREILNRVVNTLRRVRGLSFGVMRRFRWANDANFLQKVMQEYDLGALYLKLDRAGIVGNALPSSTPRKPTRTIKPLPNDTPIETPVEPTINTIEITEINTGKIQEFLISTNKWNSSNVEIVILNEDEEFFFIDIDNDGLPDREIKKEDIKEIDASFVWTPELNQNAINFVDGFWRNNPEDGNVIKDFLLKNNFSADKYSLAGSKIIPNSPFIKYIFKKENGLRKAFTLEELKAFTQS